MKTRNLSRRQRWRIQKIQDDRVKRATGHETHVEESLESGALGQEENGLVIAHYGAHLDVEVHDGQLISCKLRQNLGVIVTGDRVIIRRGEALSGIVVAVLPRNKLLARGYVGEEARAIAANVDQMMVVTAVMPWMSSVHIDRYLVIAEQSEIPAILIMNKIDIADKDTLALIERRKEIYTKLGYQFLCATTRNPEGLNELTEQLQGKSTVLVGNSGVGKSSIIRYILPFERIRVGELNPYQLGKHTTTTARLYHLPDLNGAIIDSPGIREMGLWHIQPKELIRGFKEIAPFAALCKFRNCRHIEEPNCKVKEAVASGEIAQERFDNFIALFLDLQRAN